VVTRASAAVDRGVLRQIEARMRSYGPARREPKHTRTRLLHLIEHYTAGTLGHDSPFFPEPVPAEATAHTLGDGPAGSRIIELSFPSEYRPYFAPYRDEHLRWRPNLTAHARLYLGPGGGPHRVSGRPTVVVIHGWGGGNFWLEERAFAVPMWIRHGFDVAVVQLPFHGRREPSAPGVRHGELFPSPHIVRTNEAFGQAIWDLRALTGYLREHGAPAVGVMGMSLGGYTTALWASVDPTLAFAVAMIPAVSMAELMWKHGGSTPLGRAARHAGVTLDLFAEVFAVHTPTTRPVRLRREQLMVVAGRADRICPPDHAERLAAHWHDCPIHWFPGGHLAQVGRNDAFRAVLRHLDTLDLPGRRPLLGAR